MYTLHLAPEDIWTIQFVGYRYCWSDAMSHLHEGINELSECEAWDLKRAFDADAEGGHSMFPLLNPSSKLYSKLLDFYDQIV